MTPIPGMAEPVLLEEQSGLYRIQFHALEFPRPKWSDRWKAGLDVSTVSTVGLIRDPMPASSSYW